MPNSNETKVDQRGNDMVVKAINTQDMKSEGHQRFGVGFDAHGTFKPADTARQKIQTMPKICGTISQFNGVWSCEHYI